MMSNRLPRTARYSLLLLGLGLFTGCGEDPELVRKSEQQKAEIRRLEGELQLLREKLARAPKDRSAELAEMQGEIRKEEAQIAELDTTISDLREKRRTMEQEFDKYKREYPIR